MSSNNYPLEERTTKFSIGLIGLCQKIPKTTVSTPIISQLVRSGTSIGANYNEANNACSSKDFKNKIFICKKESQETKYWLKLLINITPEEKSEIERLKQECHEFNLIFQKIILTMETKKNEN